MTPSQQVTKAPAVCYRLELRIFEVLPTDFDNPAYGTFTDHLYYAFGTTPLEAMVAALNRQAEGDNGPLEICKLTSDDISYSSGGLTIQRDGIIARLSSHRQLVDEELIEVLEHDFVNQMGDSFYREQFTDRILGLLTEDEARQQLMDLGIFRECGRYR